MYDDMTKTIEEAAKEFADKECEIGQVDWDALYKGYYHGIKDFLAKHLRDRLTAEEKEKIRKMHKRMELDAQHSDSYDCIPASDMEDAIEALESIFGAEMFDKKEK